MAEQSVNPTSEDNFFRLCSKRVSPLDTETIKNVYHRVWLMMEKDRSQQGNVTSVFMLATVSVDYVLLFVYEINNIKHVLLKVLGDSVAAITILAYFDKLE